MTILHRFLNSLVDGEQMMRRKSLDKKTGAIDNGHSPQEWTALQRLTMSASPVQSSRSTQPSRFDRFTP